MSKKKYKEVKEDDRYKLSKHLMPSEIAAYKEFGVPNLSQDWLEVFSPSVIQDLFTIKDSCSDNQLKSDYVEKELKRFGFRSVGLGTNIYTMYNSAYPGVVFKIALDDNGIADNFNDCLLQDLIPRYNRVLARHPSSIVTVQERVVVIKDPARMKSFRPLILGLLGQLVEDFLIVDLSPDRFLNYGVGRDGGFIILDGSDLYPIELVQKKLRCPYPLRQKRSGEIVRCEGKLKYSEDYGALFCEECGREYNPVDFRPSKEEHQMYDVITDGMTVDERSDLEEAQIAAIRAREAMRNNLIHHSDTIRNNSSYGVPKRQAASAYGVEGGHPYRSVFANQTGACDEDDADDPDESLGSLIRRQVAVVKETDPDDDDEDEAADSIVRGTTAAKIWQSDDEESEDNDPEYQPSDVYDQEFDIIEIDTGTEIVEGLCVIADIDTDEIPVNYLVYYIRGSEDDPSIPHTIEVDPVRVNLYAIFLTCTEINMPDDGMLHIQTHFTSFKSTMNRYALQNDADNEENGDFNKPDTEQYNTESNVSAVKPGISYRIIPVDDENDSEPGIYLEVSGDLEEAGDESGLPIYVTIPDSKASYVVLPWKNLQRFVGFALDEIRKDEMAQTRDDDASCEDDE